MAVLGVDIGGTGIKAAPVDTGTGELLAERVRILTPKPPTPAAIGEVVAHLVDGFPDVVGAVGCGFPGVVKRGVVHTAANLDPSWVGYDADAAFTARLGRDVHLANDADAAGLAELAFGAGAGVEGVVLLVTLGTGLGTALFVDGILVPNTELGHIQLDGRDVEDLTSERARIEGGLSWEEYGARLDRFLAAMQAFVSPDLIILGGGGADQAGEFLPLLHRTCPVVPAQLRNEAGIVGAAMIVHRPDA